MRAIVVDEFGPPEALRVREAPVPVPGPGEVLVETHRAPVNYVDMLVVGGSYQFLPPRPFIPGKGPAGIVAALGPGVTELRVGDRVLAMAETGGYAEAVAVAADQCHRLPPRMPFAEAASLAVVYDTSWVALRGRARLVAGETVLVLGASGGVGHAAVQLAEAMGARVLGGVARPERAAAVRAAGADAIIDLARANLRDSLREQVYAETGGRGADVIVDPLGGEVFAAAIRALAWCGRLVVIRFAAGDAVPAGAGGRGAGGGARPPHRRPRRARHARAQLAPSAAKARSRVSTRRSHSPRVITRGGHRAMVAPKRLPPPARPTMTPWSRQKSTTRAIVAASAGSLLARSCTSSTPISSPLPRTSPTQRWRISPRAPSSR